MERSSPKVKVTADDLTVVSLKVAKMGYYGGSPQAVREASITDVFNILDYEAFLNVYEVTEYELNKPKQ